MKHNITATHDKNLSFSAQIDSYVVRMDTTDEATIHAGPSPKKLLLAGLAGCTGIDVVSILNKMKVPFQQLQIDISASLTEEHPKIYHDVQILFTVAVAVADKPKFEKAVNLSKDKYCGVSAMFGHFAMLNWEIKYL